MDDQQNYIGATIFWLYIAAALVLTAIVLHTIINIPPTRPASLQDGRSHRIRTLALLATVSFTTLSANMLHVLIHSFDLWTLRHQPSLSPFSLPALLQRIYAWSTTSALFRDFATSILASPPATLWTQSALLATLYQGFAMALHGRESRVPRLWAFLALAQILPVSFAQNLFCIALVRLDGGDSGAGPRRGRGSGCVFAVDAMGVFGIYGIALAVAPWIARGGRMFLGVDLLILTVLGTRAVLVLPLFMARVKRRFRGHVGMGWIGESILWQGIGVFALRFGWFLFRGGSVWEVGPALFEHPAVTALGMDFMISMISMRVWHRLRGKPGEIEKRD